MKTSTLMWIGGGVAVWYFFLRKKETTGTATGAATSGPAVSGPAAEQLVEPELEYGAPAFWQPGWESGFRPNWGYSGGRRRHGGRRGRI